MCDGKVPPLCAVGWSCLAHARDGEGNGSTVRLGSATARRTPARAPSRRPTLSLLSGYGSQLSRLAAQIEHARSTWALAGTPNAEYLLRAC